jgi:outer membrane receptor protein involved in Fe transport
MLSMTGFSLYLGGNMFAGCCNTYLADRLKPLNKRANSENRVKLYLILILVLILNGQAIAGVTGKIVGKISDDSGVGLPGVNVSVIDMPLGAATDMDGEYQILNVSPGIYSLQISSMGYARVLVENIAVSVDLTTRQDVQLQSSVIAGETVTIVAERDMVQIDQTFSASYVDAKALAAMPVTELSQVIDVQAGVVDGHFRGGRSGEVLYMVDGIPTTDAYDGSQGAEVSVSMVQELQVISGAFNAEYGQAMSGVVNTITKDGGNKYAGSLNFYAGDYVSSHTDQFWSIDEIEPLNISNIEGNLSGPITDKLSFNSSFRYATNDGWLEGRRLFLPEEEFFWFELDGTEYRVFNPETVLGSAYIEIDEDTLDFFWDLEMDSLFYQELWDTGFFPFDSTSTGADSLIVLDWLRQMDEKSLREYETSAGDKTGAKRVKMNTEYRRSGQFKLTYVISPTSKIRFNLIANDRHYREYSADWRFTPDGRLKRYSRRQSTTIKWDKVIGADVFFDLSLSHLLSSYHHRLYDSVMDTRYSDPSVRHSNGFYYYDLGGPDRATPGYSDNAFYIGHARVGGTEIAHFERRTDTYQLQTNTSWQINKIHQLKVGGDMRWHKIHFSDENASFNSGEVVTPLGFNSNIYTRYPWEASLYTQDKMEFTDVTVNLGFRFDIFDANWKLPGNLNRPNDPAVEDVDVDAKMQVSPRLAIAYPISDSGVIHFSYGHFFQRPSFDVLYQNPDFEISGLYTLMGNPDLNVERTVQYEIGLQQGLGDDLALDLSLYSRDIRDLVSSDRLIETNTGSYLIYQNLDFGTVTGIVFGLDKRYGNNFSAGINYTWQIAEANASSREAASSSISGGNEVNKYLVPLDWDRRHTINLTGGYNSNDIWGLNALATYGSGTPYTPDPQSDDMIVGLLTNSGRKPVYMNIDISGWWNTPIRLNSNHSMSLNFQIKNLFDRLNENSVFAATGRAGYNLDWEHENAELFVSPTNYSRPREVIIGMKYAF